MDEKSKKISFGKPEMREKREIVLVSRRERNVLIFFRAAEGKEERDPDEKMRFNDTKSRSIAGTHAYARTHTHTYTHAHIHTPSLTFTHAHFHTHTHTHIHPLSFSLFLSLLLFSLPS